MTKINLREETQTEYKKSHNRCYEDFVAMIWILYFSH